MSSSNELPPEIAVERLAGDGVRYLLPRRERQRVLGFSAVIFGAGFSAVAVVFLVIGFAGAQGVFAVLSLPGLIAGTTAFGMGVTILYGHTEIELCNGILRCIERVGPFRWTRSRAADRVLRLFVTAGNSERRSSAGSRFEFFALRAELAHGKNFWLTFGYPRDWLLPLAGLLAADCSVSTATDSSVAPALVEVVDDTIVSVTEAERLVPPAGSKIAYVLLTNGLTLNVPPRGVWGGSAGMFSFSLLWCGFMVFFTAAMVQSALGVIPQAQGNLPKGNLAAIAFMTLFWAVGLGMMLAAVNMGRRRAALAVANGALMVIQTGIFGSKRREWKQAEIKTVQVGPSGMKVNNRPVMQLQIVPCDGKPVGVLTGRDVAELQWMATLLRRALLPAAESPDGGKTPEPPETA